jgi:hypothetical protein
MTELEVQAVYRIRLCSGEERRWRFLGHDALSRTRWRDMDSGREFNETSLLYVWEIIGREGAAAGG